MGVRRAVFFCILCGLPAAGTTFGTINYHTEPLADLVLDEARQRIYFVNTTLNQLEVYSTSSSASLPLKIASIATDSTPLSAAMAPSGQFLYVACYNASGIDVIDLGKLQKTSVVTLSAKPEGVAVGFDGTVLISTVGTASGQDVLVSYNPTAGATNNLQALVVTPSAPGAPVIPPPSSRMYLASQSRLVASSDGTKIAGVNELANNTRTVFVYDVASATVLLSRNVPNLSPILAISPDKTRLLSGPILFDATTLQVLAQQNAANFPYNLPSGAAGNFSTQTNQGGSAFLPNGSTLLSSYDMVPVQSPAAQPDTAQLVFNDPDNLLVSMGLQLPDNPSGKMVITSDGNTAYAISDSGFLYLPLSAIPRDVLAQASSNIALLASDQCGVTAPISTATIPVVNTGSGSRITATVTPVTTAILNPTAATTGAGGAAAAATTADAPLSKIVQQGNQASVVLQFNPAAAKSLGTVTPTDLLVQSSQAINIPPDILVSQNNRNAEAAGAIFPAAVSISSTEGLLDMAQDTTRQRLYIANAGKNRVEIFDMQAQQFLTPIKVGQLPQSLALGEDSNTLYVANGGGENISIIDLTKDAVTGTIPLPPIPFNASFAIVTPAAIASSQQGPQVLMSDGTLWKVVGNTLARRTLNPNIFGTATSIPGPVRAMASSPEGAWVLLLSGTGNAYLYSADVDDFVNVRQVVTGTITGYYGPVAAGPNGQYYLVNNLVLNQALTVVGSNSSTPSVGPTSGSGLPSPSGPTGSARPVSAVAAVNPNTFAQFSTPVLASASAAPSDAGLIELVNATTLQTSASANALEGPLTLAVGNARVNLTGGRTMAVDSAGKTAYVLTTSGLSVIPIGASSQNVPQVPGDGVVNTANFQGGIAPGGLVSLFGTGLAAQASANAPLPNILGGVCVTLNNTPLPLLATSNSQINAQIPPSLASGRYSLEVRSIANQIASSATSVTVGKYAPAIFVDDQGPAIFHQNGTRVNQSNPANRDEPLTIYATGLGVTTGAAVLAGEPSPSKPLAVTSTVQVFFGDPSYVQAQLIVDWSGLYPGSIGVYEIQCRVPGFHMSGNTLPATLRIGGISSVSGSSAPTVSVN